MEITERAIHMLAEMETTVEVHYRDFTDPGPWLSSWHPPCNTGSVSGSKWGDEMGYEMTMKRVLWPQIKTYHPEDPFALWREPDGQRYQLDRFFTKLLKLQESMKTSTCRATAVQRIAFLRIYLQELYRELVEGGSGYTMSEEVRNHFLWRKREEGQMKQQLVEEHQPGTVDEMSHLSAEQHSA